MRSAKPVLIWLTIVICAALFAFQQRSLDGYISSDFDIFYDAALRFTVDPLTIYKDDWKANVIADVHTLQGYLYPPPSILAFVPLTLGDKPQAFAVFSWAALLAAVVSLWLWLSLLVRNGLLRMRGVERGALLALALVTSPVFLNRGGQVGTFILLFCVLGVYLSSARARWLGGAALAVGGWIKIYPGLLMLYVIQQRGWSRVAAGFAIMAIGLPLLSLLVVPFEMYRLYFEQLLPTMSGRAIINIDNQSWHAVWLRAVNPAIDARTSFVALDVPALVSGAVVAVALGSIAAFSFKCRRMDRSTLPVAAVIMAWIGPMAPLGWGHSYVFVLPLLILVIAMAWDRDRWFSLIVALGCWVVLLIPSHKRLGDAAPDVVAQLFYARYPLMMIILLLLCWMLCDKAALNRQRGGAI